MHRSFRAGASEREIFDVLRAALGSIAVVIFDDDLGQIHLRVWESAEPRDGAAHR
jgi:hypothetical protein